MRPLESHLELPDGCSCCYCRPFAVGKLDGPSIGSVGLHREIPRLGSKSRLILVDPRDRLSSSLDTPRGPLSLPLLKVQRAVEVVSFRVLRVQMLHSLQPLTKLA